MMILREIIYLSNWYILGKKGSVTKHIQQFKKFSLRLKNISNDNLLDLFVGTLKETIQHEVCLLEPRSLGNASRVERKVESKDMDTIRNNTKTYRDHNVPSPNPTQPTSLTP